MKFGEFLVSNGFADQMSINDALALQRYSKKRLGRLLVELDLLQQDVLDKALITFFDCDCKLALSEVEKKILTLIGDPRLKELWKLHGILPLNISDVKIEFVTRRLRDGILQDIEAKTGKECRLFILPDETMGYLEKATSTEKRAGGSNLNLNWSLTDDEKLAIREPFTRIFRDCLEAAVKVKASDIHFEPEEKRFTIRLRVHGDLHEWKSLPIQHKEAFTAKSKSLLNLDLAISGMPQDSRAVFNDFGIDLRVNSIPTIYGEKIVARILEQNRSFDIGQCGLSPSATAALIAASKKREGLILISGPTGSGKTTTLYSLINSLDRKRKNICTLENPVEYRLSGINQVDVGTRSLSFSSALRALMRQDPDIILVGEIRDQETAELCFKAASTGHLVLSTVHANGAIEVTERLVSLGIDRLSIKSNLRLSAAQRLVRKLCPHCSVDAPSDVVDGLIGHGLPTTGKFQIINSDGCDVCATGISGGIKGRTPILEYMTGDHFEHFLEDKKTGNPLVVDSIAATIRTMAATGSIDAREALEFL
ncbi:MAG: GspE/PulE family protein [Oligoflexales bacterium]